MMGKRMAGILVALIVTIGIGAGSRLPYQAGRSEDAALRLAWRVTGVRVSECRRLSAQELSKIPAHMRQEEVCETRMLPFRLTVTVGDSTLVDALVEASGARSDRPIYVYQDLPLSPGRHAVSVSFVVQTDIPRDRWEVGTSPTELIYDQTLDLNAGEVALITYDRHAGSLIVLGFGE